MSGAASVRKGKVWEREVARRLTELTGRTHERVLTETRDGNVGDVTGGTPLVIQCKCKGTIDASGAVREAQEAAHGTGRFAVAYLKRTRRGTPKEEIVALPREDWDEIVGLLVHNGVW